MATQQDELDKLFLDRYMKELDELIVTQQDEDDPRVKEIEMKRVLYLRKDSVFTVKKGDETVTITAPEARSFLKGIVYEEYAKNPEAEMFEIITTVLTSYEGIVPLVCSLCGTSKFNLQEYLNGKRYPYLVDPLRAFFSKHIYEEHNMIEKAKIELEKVFGAGEIKRNKEREEVYEDVKMQVILFFLKLRKKNKSYSYSTIMCMLRDPAYFDIPAAYRGLHRSSMLLSAISELLGIEFSIRALKENRSEVIQRIREVFDIKIKE